MDPTSDMCFKFALNYFRADLMQNVTSSLEQVTETISVLDFLSCLEKTSYMDNIYFNNYGFNYSPYENILSRKKLGVKWKLLP